jgi:hypothetical protein
MKKILCIAVSILIIGLVAAAVWWLRRPQVIIFSDDSKVILLAVEYGKRHAPPAVKASTTSTNKAPARGRGSFTTTNDTLVVWVRQEYDASGNAYHGFQYYAYDKAGTACVGSFTTHYANTGRRNGNDVVGVEFTAFPRRQGKFLVGVQEQSNNGQEMADQKFAISNPAHGSFTKWTAEPLPARKEDDDLSVTLTKLVFGADTSYNRDQDNADDPVNKGVQAVFQVQRSGKTADNWQPVSVETSDATGNQVSGNGNTQWDGDEATTTYQWGLWPDETAWKVKFEFSQQSDFAGNELWTVQNIPLQPGRQRDFNTNQRNSQTNAVVAETELNGIHLKIFPAKQFTDVSQNNYLQGGLTIQADPALPAGMRMTLVQLTDNQTNDVTHMDYGTMTMRAGPGAAATTAYRYGLREIDGITNLNLTIALHKSRYVEFTAKPEQAAAAVAAQ